MIYGDFLENNTDEEFKWYYTSGEWNFSGLQSLQN